jgi:type II secretory pathway component GspD/PulD (secretin)
MRLRTLTLVGALAFALAQGIGALAQQPKPRVPDEPVRLAFDKADVGDVLMALIKAFRANVVFPSDSRKQLSMNVSVRSVDEALQKICAAAGLSYRQVGDTYVVATAQDLRAAIEPFGERKRIPLKSLTPEAAVTLLQGALPYLTVRPAGSQVLAIGATEDIVQAEEILAREDGGKAPVEMISEVVTVRNAVASQIATMLRNLYPNIKADAVGQSDKPGGAVGLYGPANLVASARQAIGIADQPTGPVEPDRIYRVYMIRYSSAPLLKEFLDKAAPSVTCLVAPETYTPLAPGFSPLTGVTLGQASGGGLSGGAGGTAGGVSGGSGFGAGTAGGGMARPSLDQRRAKEGDRSKMLVISGTEADIEAAIKLLEQVDVPPKQVTIDVKVVDTSPERAEELGLKWNWSSFQFLERAPGTVVDPTTGVPSSSATRQRGFGAFSRVPWSFNTILSGMITRKEAKLLASPSVQCVDNEDASIFIGDTIRSQIISQGGLSGTNIQIFEFPIGIVLLCRPRVNADGNITLRVHPVVSTITSVDPDTRIPQSSSREAETTVMVKDGETIVIGGLIRDEETRTITEVPLLSRLPLVGEIFRNRSTNRRHSEILVFITTHVVK